MKIYSPSGTVMGSTSEYMTVYTRGSIFGVCVRCTGTGLKTHDVAPWVKPVAQVAAGCSPAEVQVTCDACGGSGLTFETRK